MNKAANECLVAGSFDDAIVDFEALESALPDIESPMTQIVILEAAAERLQAKNMGDEE